MTSSGKKNAQKQTHAIAITEQRNLPTICTRNIKASADVCISSVNFNLIALMIYLLQSDLINVDDILANENCTMNFGHTLQLRHPRQWENRKIYKKCRK